MVIEGHDENGINMLDEASGVRVELPYTALIGFLVGLQDAKFQTDLLGHASEDRDITKAAETLRDAVERAGLLWT